MSKSDQVAASREMRVVQAPAEEAFGTGFDSSGPVVVGDDPHCVLCGWAHPAEVKHRREWLEANGWRFGPTEKQMYEGM